MQSFGVTTSALASMMTSYAEVSFEGDDSCNNAHTGIATHSKVIRPSLMVLGDTTIERYVTLGHTQHLFHGFPCSRSGF